MGRPPDSQAAPLPRDLPFRLVSKTIGSGAYAAIRKAIPLNRSGPVIAVKFINKEHAFKSGGLRPKQLQIELALHASVCPHENIIRFLSHGEDPSWVWMGMELAEGGDLFDKIEADEGVGEDVAHFYFTQLVSAIGWCHGKGVAHRDIKPENMLLSGEGNLKLADFGLATQYVDPQSGKTKICGMVCGSPPYIAPEIIAVGHRNQKRKSGEDKVGYDPRISDIWSCAIVLFVLLVGNTPWDTPVMQESYEYHDYVTSKGRPTDELWSNMPQAVLSLVRGMLNIEPRERMTLDNVRKHPWFTQPNAHLSKKGTAANPMALATQMLESLHIDFSAPIVQSSQRQQQRKYPQSQQAGDAMEIDSQNSLHPPQADWTTFASTQPETPIADTPFDWEAPPRLGIGGSGGGGISASQPTTTTSHNHPPPTTDHLLSLLTSDPSMSQFTPTPSVPLTLTQAARKFKDIIPSHSLARFISSLPISQLLPLLLSALHRLSIPVAAPALTGKEQSVALRFRTLDARRQVLVGSVVVERVEMGGEGGSGEFLEVRFVKAKGDPLGWRRLFKQVVVLCKEGIVVPRTGF